MKVCGFRILVQGLRVDHADIRGSGLKGRRRTDACWDWDHVEIEWAIVKVIVRKGILKDKRGFLMVLWLYYLSL